MGIIVKCTGQEIIANNYNKHLRFTWVLLHLDMTIKIRKSEPKECEAQFIRLKVLPREEAICLN